MPRKPTPGWLTYREQMDFFGCGHALWEPAPTFNCTRINIGDVGFIRRGQFHLLFSAGSPLGVRQLGVDVPITFEQLNVGPLVSSQPRLPGCLRTPTVRPIGPDLVGAGSPYLSSERGMNFSFELTGDRGAALVTRYPTYRQDSLLEAAFEAYTKRHYESWVAFARDSQYGNDIRPVLVSGLDMTRDFAMVAYSNEGTSSGCLPYTNYGPQRCMVPSSEQDMYFLPSRLGDAGSITNEFNQCVFIRYYTKHSRKPWAMFFRTELMRVGAGSHDLDSGDIRGRWSPFNDGAGSEPDAVARNTRIVEDGG
ncbi:hypothetical protein BDM02DRAFT_1963423 [Thelephora ganbajun]|uniref:Uncharacterized protein n=1 Tax=Thelephora ganbajun TaxID=370292 RepID=A0ACB6ZHS5_THEGA|nr:hypothetical protein BDM02DRAFT_1963423 [Thelephora ganbajun]